MIDPIWVLRGIEGFVLLVGAGIAYASLRAYTRTGDRSIAFMGAGFALVTVGAGLAGIIYEVATHDLLSAWISSAALEAAGFSLILYSIVRPRLLEIPRRSPPTDEVSDSGDSPSAPRT
ncbi:MAG: hypothetical protein WA688_03115 [Thermoplasmata archaeon]